jgi:hypothetical protein
MSTATSNTAALFFVTALVVLLALMLMAVFRLPEWQPKTAEGGGAPLLPPVPAQASHSLFQADPSGASPLPRRAAAASWSRPATPLAEAAPPG